LAVIIDKKAHAAIARRRGRGQDTTLYLRVEKVYGKGTFGGYSDLTVGWVPRPWPNRALTELPVGDVVLCMDSRVSRYTYWHDVTISAWRLGPFDLFTVDPNFLFHMQAWERTHPADQGRQRAPRHGERVGHGYLVQPVCVRVGAVVAGRRTYLLLSSFCVHPFRDHLSPVRCGN
jgi:hypothetical protein